MEANIKWSHKSANKNETRNFINKKKLVKP